MINTLSYNGHIVSIVNRKLKMLGFVKGMASDFHDIYVIKLLYVTLVKPIVEYGSLVWYPF